MFTFCLHHHTDMVYFIYREIHMKTGTPKNISEAVANALNEIIPGEDWKETDPAVEAIVESVRERLSQDFTYYLLLDKTDLTKNLWEKIFPEGGRNE